MAENCDPKYIFTIPRAILPKPSLCDEMTATKSRNEIVASRSVCSLSVCRGQLTWLEFGLLKLSSQGMLQVKIMKMINIYQSMYCLFFTKKEQNCLVPLDPIFGLASL